VKRVNVTYVGPEEEYGSSDPHDGGREILLRPGEFTAVSKPKADQLYADFPGWFEFGETIGTDDPATAVEAAAVAEAERVRVEREAQEARERDDLRRIEEDARLAALLEAEVPDDVQTEEADAQEPEAAVAVAERPRRSRRRS
jgi:hypothetical protein